MNPRKILQRLKSPTPYGVNANWVEINKRVGIKVFYNERPFKLTLQRQTYAAKRGLAPRIYNSFSFNEEEWSRLYCIVMERANTIVDCKKGYDSDWYRKAKLIENNKNFQRDYRELLEKFYDYGIEVEDLHIGNVGYINRKLVCIDWAGCESNDDSYYDSDSQSNDSRLL